MTIISLFLPITMADSSDSTDLIPGMITGGIEIPRTPHWHSNSLSDLILVSSRLSCFLMKKSSMCNGEPFHTTVSRLLFQAIPSLELEVIDASVKTFFTSNHITTEDRLSKLIPDDDLPDRTYSSTEPYWKIVLL